MRTIITENGDTSFKKNRISSPPHYTPFSHTLIRRKIFKNAYYPFIYNYLKNQIQIKYFKIPDISPISSDDRSDSRVTDRSAIYKLTPT